MKKYLILATGVIVVIILVAVVQNRQTRPTQNTAAVTCNSEPDVTITAGEHELNLALASTTTERHQGLAECTELPENGGMYFSFSPPRETAFWMKDMRMSIDIIWVANGEVVGVMERVSPPEAGQADSDLPIFPSGQPVDAVIEISAGQAEQLGLEVGTAVSTPDLEP